MHARNLMMTHLAIFVLFTSSFIAQGQVTMTSGCSMPELGDRELINNALEGKSVIPQYGILVWRCRNGYKATNMQQGTESSQSFCMNEKWVWQSADNEMLRCAKVQIATVCFSPEIQPGVVMKRLNYVGKGFVYRSYIQLSCNDSSLQLVGKAANLCDKAGETGLAWTFDWPKCSVRVETSTTRSSLIAQNVTPTASVTCAPVYLPLNAKPTTTNYLPFSEQQKVYTIVSFVCLDGFQLARGSSNQIICLPHGGWTGLPRCVEKVPKQTAAPSDETVTATQLTTTRSGTTAAYPNTSGTTYSGRGSTRDAIMNTDWTTVWIGRMSTRNVRSTSVSKTDLTAAQTTPPSIQLTTRRITHRTTQSMNTNTNTRVTTGLTTAIAASQVNATLQNSTAMPTQTTDCTVPYFDVGYTKVFHGSHQNYNFSFGSVLQFSCQSEYLKLGNLFICSKKGWSQPMPHCKLNSANTTMIPPRSTKPRSTIDAVTSSPNSLSGQITTTSPSTTQQESLTVANPTTGCVIPEESELVINVKTGVRRNGEYIMGSILQASCHQGTISDNNYLICTLEGWLYPLPTCVITYTTLPTKIQKASTAKQEGKHITRSIVLSQQSCQISEKQYSKITVRLGTKTDSGYAPSSVIELSCPEGQTLERPFMACFEGVWNHPPFPCKNIPTLGPSTTTTTAPGLDVKCESPTELENGFSTLLPTKSLKMGSVVTYTCRHGYSVKGKVTAVCLDTGNWSHAAPLCEPQLPESGAACDPIRPPQYSQWNVIRTEGQGDVLFPAGTVVTFACDMSYIMIGADLAVCMETIDGSSQWSAPPPQCGKPTCTLPSIPDFVDMVMYPNPTGQMSRYPVGTIVIFSCSDGSPYVGPTNILSCTEIGEWSSSVPRCKRSILTTTPSQPTQSIPTVQHILATENAGGITATGEITTTDTADVITALPIFIEREVEASAVVPLFCNPPDIPNSLIEYVPPSNNSTQIPHRTLSKYSCDAEFTLSGAAFRVCDNGQWSNEAPTCMAKLTTTEKPTTTRSRNTNTDNICPSDVNDPNLKMLLIDGTQKIDGYALKSVVNFFCADKFELKGYSFQSCESYGWSNNIPTCFAIA